MLGILSERDYGPTLKLAAAHAFEQYGRFIEGMGVHVGAQDTPGGEIEDGCQIVARAKIASADGDAFENRIDQGEFYEVTARPTRSACRCGAASGRLAELRRGGCEHNRDPYRAAGRCPLQRRGEGPLLGGIETTVQSRRAIWSHVAKTTVAEKRHRLTGARPPREAPWRSNRRRGVPHRQRLARQGCGPGEAGASA
jgi:hypothetical protein